MPPGKFCKITPKNTHFCTFWKPDILGQTWHEMKKLEKWGTFVALVPQSWVNLLISQTF